MNVNKKVIGELEKCYALATLRYQNKDHFLVASEISNDCYLFDLDGNKEETIWKEPGGVMTMEQVPGTDGQFLATRKFYSPNDFKESSIVIATPKGKDDWEIRTLVDLPGIHRFDILPVGDVNYLIACTVKTKYEYEGDWRFPGKIYVAVLPKDLSAFNSDNQLGLTVLRDNMLKNHGYARHIAKDGTLSSIISTDNGIFQVTPPASVGADWTVKELVSDAASDAVLIDLDGDGEEEICAIAPFHGADIKIYRKVNGKYEVVYTHPEKLPFLHAIFGGEIAGKPTWIIGHREGKRYLLAFTFEDGEFKYQVLDEGCGAANALHFVHNGKDVLIASNREVNEIAYYELT